MRRRRRCRRWSRSRSRSWSRSWSWSWSWGRRRHEHGHADGVHQIVAAGITRSGIGKLERRGSTVGGEGKMKMLEGHVGRVGGAGGWRTNRLIEQARVVVADCLDADINLTGLGAENAGIEIDAVGLAGGGGKNLREGGPFGSKGGRVGSAGRSLGGFADAPSGRGYGPGGNGISGSIGSGLEIAIGDKILTVGRETGTNRQSTGQEDSTEFHYGWDGKRGARSQS